MSVITISRGTFSDGKMLAERLSATLGYRGIDRDAIVERAAARGVTEVFQRDLDTTASARRIHGQWRGAALLPMAAQAQPAPLCRHRELHGAVPGLNVAGAALHLTVEESQPRIQRRRRDEAARITQIGRLVGDHHRMVVVAAEHAQARAQRCLIGSESAVVATEALLGVGRAAWRADVGIGTSSQTCGNTWLSLRRQAQRGEQTPGDHGSFRSRHAEVIERRRQSFSGDVFSAAERNAGGSSALRISWLTRAAVRCSLRANEHLR